MSELRIRLCDDRGREQLTDILSGKLTRLHFRVEPVYGLPRDVPPRFTLADSRCVWVWDGDKPIERTCPYAPGDRVGIDEPFCLSRQISPRHITIVYLLDGARRPCAPEWYPASELATHKLPEWAIRYWLRVKDVEVLQIKYTEANPEAWCLQHGKDSWTNNDWVWVVNFALDPHYRRQDGTAAE